MRSSVTHTSSLSSASDAQAQSAAAAQAQAPYLVRHAWVGYLLFVLSAAGFGVLIWQVKSDGALTHNDLPLARAIYQWAKQQPLPLVLFMRFLSAAGRDGLGLFVLLLCAGYIKHKARRELGFALVGVLGGEVWFQLFASLIARQRPEFKDPFEKLIGYGFPSGHSTTSLLLAGMILYLLLPHIRSPFYRWGLILFNVGLVLLISFSRLFLGLHYLTDIFGGYLLGLAWGGLAFTSIDLWFWHLRVLKSLNELPHAQESSGAVRNSSRFKKRRKRV